MRFVKASLLGFALLVSGCSIDKDLVRTAKPGPMPEVFFRLEPPPFAGSPEALAYVRAHWVESLGHRTISVGGQRYTADNRVLARYFTAMGDAGDARLSLPGLEGWGHWENRVFLGHIVFILPMFGLLGWSSNQQANLNGAIIGLLGLGGEAATWLLARPAEDADRATAIRIFDEDLADRMQVPLRLGPGSKIAPPDGKAHDQ